MVFDRLAHGIGALIPPYYHHPRAPAVPDTLGQALRHSYAVCRLARFVGCQAHPITHRDHSFSSTVPAPPGVLTPVAQFTAVRPPPWASSVLVIASYGLLAGVKVSAHHQVQVTDGALTHTSPTISSEAVDIEERFLGTGFIEWREEVLRVPLSSVDMSQPLTVTLRAFASNDNVNAVHYRPAQAMAWWITEG